MNALNDINAVTSGDVPMAQRVSLLVPDMRCAACARSINNALETAPGFGDVVVSLADKRVSVTLRASQTPANLQDCIEGVGFQTRPDRIDEQELSLKQERRRLLARLGVAGIGMMQVMMFALAGYLAGPEGMDAAYEALFRWASLALAVPVTFFSASVFHAGAIRDLKRFTAGMDVPVSLAILSAFSLSTYNTLAQTGEVYFDSVCMFTFFLLVARFIESRARSEFAQSRRLTEQLLPVSARRAGDKGFVPLEELRQGMWIEIRTGEPIPADGVVREGDASVDESMFTGEVLPVGRHPGDRVFAGSRNLDGDLVIEATAVPGDFLIDQVSDLYQRSRNYRPDFAVMADTIARYFVATILTLAVCAGAFWFWQGAGDWFAIALTVLVVSCPCALSLATPVAYTVAASTLRRHGLVVSDGAFLERAALVDTVVFDKTGTLTRANYQVAEIINSTALMDSRVLGIVAALERVSEHPLANAFVDDGLVVESAINHPGAGVSGTVENIDFRFGAPAFAAAGHRPPDARQWLALGFEGQVCWVRMTDSLRDDAQDVIASFRAAGIRTVLLTGDPSPAAAELGKQLAFDQVHIGASAEDKVSVIRSLQSGEHKVLMVGDGINDAAAMGAAFTAVSVQPIDAFVQSAADATLLADQLNSLVVVQRFARRIRRIVRQNLTWAATYNFSVIPLAVAGLLAPWMAALGMSLSSVAVVLNANRLIKVQ